MINQLLERRYADCAELEEAWKEFLDQFKQGTNSKKNEISPDFDQEFLTTKARIAMLHDSFLESLKHDQNIAQTMLELVNRSISARHLRKMSDSDQKKVEQEWHECYLLLNSTVVGLSEERERLGEINEFNHNLSRIQTNIKVNVLYFLRSVTFKIIVAFAILLGIWFGVPESQWNKLRGAKGIGGPYTAYLDFQRSTLGFPAPYTTIDKFVQEELMPETITSGYSAEENTKADPNQQKIDDTAFFDGMFNVGDQTAAAFLRSAEGFRTFRLTDETMKTDLSCAIFFWFEPGNAKKFRDQFRLEASGTTTNAQILSQTFTVYLKENVLVIISDRDDEIRSQMISRIFPTSSF
ncbi:MAG: hypothetical protein ACFCU1_01385 [Sumerlaeia bacterium]